MQEIITKAGTLLEALPYIQRFRSQVFVVKYGGSFMDSPDPAERHRVAREIVFLEAVGINPVVVHGGGKAVTRAVEAAGLTTTFLQARSTRKSSLRSRSLVARPAASPVPRFSGAGSFRLTTSRANRLILASSAKSTQ